MGGIKEIEKPLSVFLPPGAVIEEDGNKGQHRRRFPHQTDAAHDDLPGPVSVKKVKEDQLLETLRQELLSWNE